MPSHVRYDPILGLEAYRFQGLHQTFPGHFHPYYFMGYIQSGHQLTAVCGTEREVGPNTLLLFDPGLVHTCRPAGPESLEYCCLNISPEIMERWVEEVTGKPFLPSFSPSLIPNAPQIPALRALHSHILDREPDLCPEEAFLLLLGSLLEDYAHLSPAPESLSSAPVRAAEDFLRANYTRPVSLSELAERNGQSHYQLLRAFSRQTGLTPHSYLINLRVTAAKALLEAGLPPAQAALEVGFADQSHLNRHFKRRFGLTPSQCSPRD